MKCASSKAIFMKEVWCHVISLIDSWPPIIFNFFNLPHLRLWGCMLSFHKFNSQVSRRPSCWRGSPYLVCLPISLLTFVLMAWNPWYHYTWASRHEYWVDFKWKEAERFFPSGIRIRNLWKCSPPFNHLSHIFRWCVPVGWRSFPVRLCLSTSLRLHRHHLLPVRRRQRRHRRLVRASPAQRRTTLRRRRRWRRWRQSSGGVSWEGPRNVWRSFGPRRSTS